MSVSGEPLLSIYNSRNYWSLLAELSSKVKKGEIYNSRNYWSLLAYEPMTVYRPKSTIVEIIEAY